MKVHIRLVQLAKFLDGSMLTPFALDSQHINWRDLYLLALFETDSRKSAARIAEAEKALILREHELFTHPVAASERDAVNTALHALHALKHCLATRSTTLAA